MGKILDYLTTVRPRWTQLGTEISRDSLPDHLSGHFRGCHYPFPVQGGQCPIDHINPSNPAPTGSVAQRLPCLSGLKVDYKVCKFGAKYPGELLY